MIWYVIGEVVVQENGEVFREVIGGLLRMLFGYYWGDYLEGCCGGN